MKVHANLRPGQFDFNMTPMIDVVFLLIIFFLVSSHLAKQESQLPLPLPTAETGTEIVDDQRPRVVVNVEKDGRILLAGKSVTLEEIGQRLQVQRNRDGDDLEVRIRCDRSVPYEFVKPIMLAAAEAGVWNVNFAVIRPEDAR
ncbi:ExbD/TolR family protein [Blastopirellula marina]|uniref:Biopolymer transporter ExbD n=1 Tax=Blastopirellula marina TaxID=124 RepID=A0A2S8GGZ0_9BACT|nr:biopolymer transporter ExbD [Blastopirellula marina]PQO40150.1 biopolymer transporter ExbD [Blastopirellula marina]PQO43580.1 biopolymer transporter ExbD [Blastopirellula marina]PTL45517.1 biopolymer transporter ExbD [Blastopirellula marina]